MTERIRVTASKSYEVLVGSGLLNNIGSYAKEVIPVCKAAVISDSNVGPLYAETVKASLSEAGYEVSSFIFPAGEESKTLATYGEILNFLASQHLSRSDMLVAVGGGVTGDMAGFAAATFLRGIRFIQVPTTLLAAVDSSVGGKTAIDLPIGKNLVGCFSQPSLVLCDTDVIAKVPQNVYRDGCAEVIKYGVYGNAPFFASLSETAIKDQLQNVISTCVSMKRDVVCEDEFDTGLRRVLNLGHSFGHAVEACSEYTISHGCAVAIGMCIITRAASAKGICSAETVERLVETLQKYDLPTETDYSAEELYQAALSDKKMASGKMHLVVPEGIGSWHIESIRPEEMMDWLKAGGVK